MPRTLEQIIACLPDHRREHIEDRAAELMTLRDLRQAMHKTQEDLATALHMGQDGISRLERRSDMLLSMLRGYVEAMGGDLKLIASFPDRPPVVIQHLSHDPAPPIRSKRRQSAK